MSKVILLTITLAGEPTDEPAEMPHVFTSADKANAFLAAWCRHWWKDEFEERMPEDDEAVIDRYFANARSDGFEMLDTELDPEGGPFVAPC